MNTCGCWCNTTAAEATKSPGCTQSKEIASECPVTWQIMSQNLQLRFLVQDPDWVDKIYLFDPLMKQIGYISIRWDNKKMISISSTFFTAKKERYRKVLRSSSGAEAENELQNILLNFDGNGNIVLWALWGDLRPKLFTIRLDGSLHGDQINISFGKTLRRHNVRFNRPSKSTFKSYLARV